MDEIILHRNGVVKRLKFKRALKKTFCSLITHLPNAGRDFKKMIPQILLYLSMDFKSV
jgi:hypothetical protein